MCGIAGFIDTSGSTAADQMVRDVARMTAKLAHRGPDDVGVWSDVRSGVAMGHRRLSVIDLSPDGHQPMRSISGRYVVTFNGEIYNFRELRADLAARGATFRGASDTAVLLEAVSIWGLEQAVRRVDGMFALAIWDTAERRLHLVRDRLGEKPLYYGSAGAYFFFASELKALVAHPSFDNPIDRTAISLFFRHGYIPAPHSAFERVHKLHPGTILTVKPGVRRFTTATSSYWDIGEMAEAGRRQPFDGTPDEAVQRLDTLLTDSVRSRMVADVPLGAFLSGGIDSSTVVAIMQAGSHRPIKTFTIGFSDGEYDESAPAEVIAKHVGTEHTQLRITSVEAMEVVPRLPVIFDEPFADPSQIPTILLAQLARKSVTVSLSGDGGDELFGGYSRYIWARWLYRYFQLASTPRLGHLVRSSCTETLELLGQGFRLLAGNVTHPALCTGANRAARLASLLRSNSLQEAYLQLLSIWNKPSDLVLGVAEPMGSLPARVSLEEFTREIMSSDAGKYLPDDILTKVDRATMSVALETRVPFLSHQLVEFASSLPLDMNFRNNRGKWLVRKLAGKYLPAEVIRRPKHGFSIPIGGWLRAGLRDWAEATLNSRRLTSQGILNAGVVQATWNDHIAGRKNHGRQLWSVLMFQAWLLELESHSNCAALAGPPVREEAEHACAKENTVC
jgi:asparagine synthase (glutamine-hydrolysing)